MTDNTLNEMLEMRRRELQAAVTERDRQNVRIIQLENDIRSLQSLIFKNVLANRINRPEDQAVGLTDAIRSVLRLNTTPMSAAQVKQSLDLIGFDFRNFSNASAAVHNTLKRLVDSGELRYAPGIKVYDYPYMNRVSVRR